MFHVKIILKKALYHCDNEQTINIILIYAHK